MSEGVRGASSTSASPPVETGLVPVDELPAPTVLLERLSPYSIEARVAAGAAWLDGVLPGWWLPDRFDLSRFELADDCNCVIGQLGPVDCLGFDDTVGGGWLDLNLDLAWRYGFFAGSPAYNAAEYQALDDEWRWVIAGRREVSGG